MTHIGIIVSGTTHNVPAIIHRGRSGIILAVNLKALMKEAKESGVVIELIHRVGEGCYRALRSSAVFDHIEAKAIAACKADIGKRPDDSESE